MSRGARKSARALAKLRNLLAGEHQARDQRRRDSAGCVCIVFFVFVPDALTRQCLSQPRVDLLGGLLLHARHHV